MGGNDKVDEDDDGDKNVTTTRRRSDNKRGNSLEDGNTSSGEEEGPTATSNNDNNNKKRRKRFSRREQKARKKLKKQQQHLPQEQEQQPNQTDDPGQQQQQEQQESLTVVTAVSTRTPHGTTTTSSDSSSPTSPAEEPNAKKKKKQKKKKKDKKSKKQKRNDNDAELINSQEKLVQDLQQPSSSSTSTSTSNHQVVVVSETTNKKGTQNNTADLSHYDHSYVPTPIPTMEELTKRHHGAQNNNDNNHNSNKPLGKWFPKAVMIKSRQPPVATSEASLLLFYQYVDPQWSERVTQQLMAFLCQIAEQYRILGGRIRVAREGVNATVSSRDYDYDSTNDTENDSSSRRKTRKTTTAASTLRHFVKDLQAFHPVFYQTDFKFIDNLSGDRHFKDLKLFPVKELVYYGLDDSQAPLDKGGKHLSAQEFHSKLEEQDTVVVDVRNHYEAAIGRFDGQQQQQHGASTAKSSTSSVVDGNSGNDDDANNIHQTGKTKESSSLTATTATTKVEKGGHGAGAVYIDPKMRKSTDFASWLQKPETQSQLAGKQVLLYCTGGVRCERASAHLNYCMGNQPAGVYQLQGGIERYLQTFPDGGYWRGKNFVFDKREAIDVHNPDGDGGVIHATTTTATTSDKAGKNTKMKPKDAAPPPPTLLLPEMKCCICQTPWNRYVGKKKCGTCGVPVLMCDACMTQQKRRPEQQRQKQNSTTSSLIRCPLCVEENVTVRADEVEWTDNGVRVCPVPTTTTERRNEKETGSSLSSSSAPQKAAPSVLKWGGGHASEKKERRRWQRKPCKFGAACKRSECFFAHPPPNKLLRT